MGRPSIVATPLSPQEVSSTSFTSKKSPRSTSPDSRFSLGRSLAVRPCRNEYTRPAALLTSRRASARSLCLVLQTGLQSRRRTRPPRTQSAKASAAKSSSGRRASKSLRVTGSAATCGLAATRSQSRSVARRWCGRRCTTTRTARTRWSGRPRFPASTSSRSCCRASTSWAALGQRKPFRPAPTRASAACARARRPCTRSPACPLASMCAHRHSPARRVARALLDARVLTSRARVVTDRDCMLCH